LGAGWVGEEALAIGLYAALVGGSFPETLAIAANHDGDSDSTASIAGQLFGASKGVAEIPHRWVRRLDVIEPVYEVLGGLISANR
jgi:ADP-ribosylglycohydrolase